MTISIASPDLRSSLTVLREDSLQRSWDDQASVARKLWSPRSTLGIVGDKEAEVVAGMHPHELLPVFNRKIIQEWVVFDRSRESFRTIDDRDAFVNDLCVVRTRFRFRFQTIQGRAARHFSRPQHASEYPLDDRGPKNPRQAKAEPVHAACRGRGQMLADLREVPVLRFRVSPRAQFLDFRNDFVARVKIKPSSFCLAHRLFLFSNGGVDPDVAITLGSLALIVLDESSVDPGFQVPTPSRVGRQRPVFEKRFVITSIE